MEAADEQDKVPHTTCKRSLPAHLAWLELGHRHPPPKVHIHLNDVAEIFLYFLKTMGISGELGDGWDTDRHTGVI